jgi:extradiol dioxygenase family protein
VPGLPPEAGPAATCGVLTHERALSQPFHFAFFVRDLASTRRFYDEILGCREGRSTETWVDFDFFGNQISAHTTGAVTPTQNTGQVEGVLVPMPHFGALLAWDAFEALAGRIRAAGHAFILEPRVRYAGQPGEQATMFLLDPSGNALEFKSFKQPEQIFTA